MNHDTSPLLVPSPATFPVAIQSTGKAATAEMVCANIRPGEEEGDPRYDDVSVAPSASYLQLPSMEGLKDCLQKVAAQDTP